MPITNPRLGTPEQLRDPNYTPALSKAIPLGIQHVLAMFISNVTPAIIIAGAAGFGFGSNSPDFPSLIYMIQMSMMFAGVATLLQTIGFGPVGARLPIVQGTSFAFVPIMIPLVAGKGVDAMATVMGGVLVGGLFHALIAPFIGRLRFAQRDISDTNILFYEPDIVFFGQFVSRLRLAFPPMVTGIVVMMIGLTLLKIGVQYAAGGVPAIGTPEYGSLLNWSLALVVIVVTLLLKFFTRGMISASAVLLGLVSGYIVALALGMVNFDAVGRASVFALPDPLHFGIEFSFAAIFSFCLMAVISAIETVGDVSVVTKSGAGREATQTEIRGATYADGFGTAIAGVFGALPNTSFSQNVGLVAMTGVMSRHVVTYGAIFLVIAGLVPKVGALVSTIPIEVLGGGVIVMFGMVVSAGVSMLSVVDWNRRNMVIFAVAVSFGFGLQLEPEALQHLPPTAKTLLTTGLLPAAFISIALNLLLPPELPGDR